jgi:hypothetical protein
MLCSGRRAARQLGFMRFASDEGGAVIYDFRDWPACRALHAALPHCQQTSAGTLQRLGGTNVAFPITGNLFGPKFWPRRRHSEEWAVMAVPEAAMYQDDRMIFRKHNIRLAGKLCPMQPEA